MSLYTWNRFILNKTWSVLNLPRRPLIYNATMHFLKNELKFPSISFMSPFLYEGMTIERVTPNPLVFEYKIWNFCINNKTCSRWPEFHILKSCYLMSYYERNISCLTLKVTPEHFTLPRFSNHQWNKYVSNVKTIYCNWWLLFLKCPFTFRVEWIISEYFQIIWAQCSSSQHLFTFLLGERSIVTQLLLKFYLRKHV